MLSAAKHLGSSVKHMQILRCVRHLADFAQDDMIGG